LQKDEVTPAQITANQDDYAGCDGKAVCRITLDGDYNLTSFASGGDWREFILINIDDTDAATLVHEAGTGTAANKIITNSAADLALGPGKAALFQYDNTTSRWRVYELGGGGVTVEADTLNTVFARGNRIDGATEANPVEVRGSGGAANYGWNVYTDSTNTPQIKCVIDNVLGDCDVYVELNDAKKWGVKDSAGNVELEHTEDTGISAMTVNAETGGVTITVPFKKWLPFAACQNTTATMIWDTPTSGAAAAACFGTNSVKGVADFDASSDESIHVWEFLPSDFTGQIDVRVLGFAAATTGTARLGVRVDCSSNGESHDVTSTNLTTFAWTPNGTTNFQASATATGITITGCLGADLAKIQFFRDADGTSGTDDMAGDFRGIGLELTIRRAM
jgi:hypothetical protein